MISSIWAGRWVHAWQHRYIHRQFSHSISPSPTNANTNELCHCNTIQYNNLDKYMILRRLDDNNNNKITAVITLDCPLGPKSSLNQAARQYSIPSQSRSVSQLSSLLTSSFLSFVRSFVRSSFRTHMTSPAPRWQKADTRRRKRKTRNRTSKNQKPESEEPENQKPESQKAEARDRRPGTENQGPMIKDQKSRNR
jgi:hypothetical protein